MSTQVNKKYEYVLDNGKTKVVNQYYKVKNPKSLKVAANKEKFIEYIRLNKNKILEQESKKIIKYIIEKSKEDLDLIISSTGAKMGLKTISE